MSDIMYRLWSRYETDNEVSVVVPNSFANTKFILLFIDNASFTFISKKLQVKS